MSGVSIIYGSVALKETYLRLKTRAADKKIPLKRLVGLYKLNPINHSNGFFYLGVTIGAPDFACGQRVVMPEEPEPKIKELVWKNWLELPEEIRETMPPIGFYYISSDYKI